jgi:hypothetical protein
MRSIKEVLAMAYYEDDGCDWPLFDTRDIIAF